MNASRSDCIEAYEQARRWGNQVGRLQILLCRYHSKWRLKRKGEDVDRLIIIALEHGLEGNKA